MSWRARKRKAQARAWRRASQPVYASVPPAWASKSPDELLADITATMHKLLGFTPMADAMLELEMRTAMSMRMPAPLSPFAVVAI